MFRRMKPLLLLAALLPAAPAAAQRAIPYGPPQRAEGVYRTGFESSDFQGCWVDFTPRGQAEFDRLKPAIDSRLRHGGRAWQVSWLIRRTPNVNTPPRGQGYGHLGMSKCQVEVQRVYAVRATR